MSMPLALLEVLDRDGQVQHQFKVRSWPVRVGRALDNDWVLDDPYSAAHHFTLDADDVGLQVQVGQTLNGLTVGGKALAAGQSAYLSAPVVLLQVGRTTLRLRLPSQALAPEVRIEAWPRVLRGQLALWGSITLACMGVVLYAWLTSDPGEWLVNLGLGLLMGAGVLLGWSGLWALLCKVITRRSHFGWHLRVALLASLVWAVVRVVPGWIAFTLSWPAVSSFAFVLPHLVLAVAMTYHLRKVELHSAARRRGVVGVVLCLGLGLHLWGNQIMNSHWGQDLYLSHLYPPEWRTAPAHDMEQFMRRVNDLQEVLDEDLGDDDS